MTTTTFATRRTGARTGFVVGAGYGAVLALVFALLVRSFPSTWLTETGPRFLLFVVAAAVAPPTVWAARRLAAVVGSDPRPASYGGVIGAATFDGLAIGFVPELYGQTGRALAAVAALILFALATVGVADRLMRPRDAG